MGVGAAAVGGLAVTRFWSGRRVLVTGHTGFKGSWLALWLQRLGAHVVGVSRSVPTVPSLFEAAGVGREMTSVEADVGDLDRMVQIVAEHRPEVVLHLAAQPLVRAGFEDPAGTYVTNVLGTVHVLEAVRRVGGVRVVVNVATDKVYENREWEWPYREDDQLGGHDPYSSSKACSELVTSAYRRSFLADAGTRVATARAGNVIGGGDWAAQRLVPDLLRGALEGETVRIRNPAAVRPWQHVLNPLAGYLLLAEALWDAPEHATAWNFGPDPHDARPVAWIADRLAALWGPELRWAGDPGPHPHEAGTLRLDSSRAQARLGWSPRWGLDAALERIVEFTRAQAAGADLRQVALDQIEAFEAAGDGDV